MKFLTILSAFSSVALAQYLNTTSSAASSSEAVDVTTITKDTVVTEFTTYCPYPTTIVTNNKTITVDHATTLTITDCPCSIKTTITTSGSIPPEETTAAPSESGHEEPGHTTTISKDTVVTEFTTYCPEATTIVTNGKTYTATGETTLTITDCPCTVPTHTVVTNTPGTPGTPGTPAAPSGTTAPSQGTTQGTTQGTSEGTSPAPSHGTTQAPSGTTTQAPAGSSTTLQTSATVPGSSSGPASVEIQSSNGAGSLQKAIGGSIAGLIAAVAYLF